MTAEVVSPSDTASSVNGRLLEFLDAGTRLLWVVDPASRSVLVYRSRRDVRALGAGETLEREEILPGFTVPLDDLFESD